MTAESSPDSSPAGAAQPLVDLPAAELRRWCAKSLSPQEVPVGVEIVGSLPRTMTGKVRKNELALSLAGRQARLYQSRPQTE